MKRNIFLSAALLAASAGAWAAGGMTSSEEPALAQAKAEAQAAALRSSQFERQAREATDEAARARAKAESLIADIERIEAEITQGELRVAMIDSLRRQRQARIADREEPVIRLTSALQTMVRRPPALALVQPGSLQDIMRLRAMLASTLPVVRERTAGLRAEAAKTRQLQKDASAALSGLAASRAALQGRRINLARLEERQLQLSGDLVQAALYETDRSIALAERADELSKQMHNRNYQARLGRELASLSGPISRPIPQAAPPRRTGLYSLPVEGRLITGMGEISDAGVHSRGLTFETAPNALVVAPRAGRIVYAGRFRSYGEVVIIDHGQGWSSTIINLTVLRVRQGENVLPGDPIGRANRQITIELRHNGQPQPIVSFIGDE